MYPESYTRWHTKTPNHDVSVEWKIIEITNPTDPIHKCAATYQAVTQNELRTVFDVEQDFKTNQKNVVQVDMKGPQFYCPKCNKYFSSTCACVRLPKKARYSVEWADEMIRRIVTTDLSLRAIAPTSGLTPSVISRELTRRTKRFTDTIQTYAPCELLFILPYHYKDEQGGVIGGIMNGEWLLYDILPTYSAGIIKDAITRVQKEFLRCIVVGMYSDVYEVCKKQFPDVDICPTDDRPIYHIHLLKNMAGHKSPLYRQLNNLKSLLCSGSDVYNGVIKWYQCLSENDTAVCADLYQVLMSCDTAINNIQSSKAVLDHLQGGLELASSLTRRYDFAKARYLLLTCPNAVCGTSTESSADAMNRMMYVGTAANVRRAFAMAMMGQPETLWYDYAIRFEALTTIDIDEAMSYEKNLPYPYYYDTIPYYYIDGNENNGDPVIK